MNIHSRALAALAVALAAVVGLQGAPVAASAALDDPAAHAGENAGYPDRDTYLGKTVGYRPSIMMVGDSITYRGERTLRARGVKWEISSVPGRNLSTAKAYVTDRLENPSPLRLLVVALGTNADVGVNQAEDFFRSITKMVPRSTKVAFVTTYRSAKWNAEPAFRRQAWPHARYSASMRKVAAERRGTCIVEWRNLVVKHDPAWIPDGVHPGYTGYRYWTALVQRRAMECVKTGR